MSTPTESDKANLKELAIKCIDGYMEIAEETEKFAKGFDYVPPKDKPPTGRELIDVITREAREKEAQKYDTKDGYCCACWYDIAGFEKAIRDEREATKRKCIEAVNAKMTSHEDWCAAVNTWERCNCQWKEVVEALKSL